MLLRQLFDRDTSTFTYLVADEETRQALLIDPVITNTSRDLQLVEDLGLRLKYVLDTHVHADHVTGAGEIRDKSSAQIAVSSKGSEAADIHLEDGDVLMLGSLAVQVLATPGHTDDSISFKIGSDVFTGDALFVRGTGRTDFQNGDPRALYDSITKKIWPLPDATRIWPGHDYRGHSMSTVGEEKVLNPRLANQTKEQFIATMDALNLPAPKLLDIAVPANRECGLGTSVGETAEPVVEATADTADAFARGAGNVVIDVREPHEFVGELGHIPGAINVPREEIAQAALDWQFDAPMMFVCRSGRRSRSVCEQLVRRGFRDVVNLDGGMLAYRELKNAGK